MNQLTTAFLNQVKCQGVLLMQKGGATGESMRSENDTLEESKVQLYINYG